MSALACYKCGERCRKNEYHLEGGDPKGETGGGWRDRQLCPRCWRVYSKWSLAERARLASLVTK